MSAFSLEFSFVASEDVVPKDARTSEERRRCHGYHDASKNGNHRHNRASLQRPLASVSTMFLALARMRLPPERGSSQREAPGTFKVARGVSPFPFSTHMSTETVRCVGADDEFTRGQVVLSKSHYFTVVNPANVLPYSTNASRHAGSSDVSRPGVVTLLNFESFRDVVFYLSIFR